MAGVPTITTLILADHERLRLGFTGLDEAPGQEELSDTWDVLSARLEAHAEAEELIFYPALAGCGWIPREAGDDPGQHHARVLDAIRDADAAPVGTDRWWDAVGRAKAAITKRLDAEERYLLPAFRRHVSEDLQEDLDRAWLAFYAAHRVGFLDGSCGEHVNRFVAAETNGPHG